MKNKRPTLKQVIELYYPQVKLVGGSYEKTAAEILAEYNSGKYYVVKIPTMIQFVKDAIHESMNNVSDEEETELNNFIVNSIAQRRLVKEATEDQIKLN